LLPDKHADCQIWLFWAAKGISMRASRICS
jgi:hypothetical protein